MSRKTYAPTNPVQRGGLCRAPGRPSSIVQSAIVGTNSDLLREVCALWTAPTDIIADVTYGKGVFWRWSKKLPHHRFDLADGVDARSLPLDNASCDVVVIDPPYRSTHGSVSTQERTDGMFGNFALGSESLDSMDDVLNLYGEMLVEARRVLRSDGRVFVKCQDMTYSSRLHLASLDVLERMNTAGFELLDQFILMNTTRIPARGTQKVARRSHSVLWVGGRREVVQVGTEKSADE